MKALKTSIILSSVILFTSSVNDLYASTKLTCPTVSGKQLSQLDENSYLIKNWQLEKLEKHDIYINGALLVARGDVSRNPTSFSTKMIGQTEGECKYTVMVKKDPMNPPVGAGITFSLVRMRSACPAINTADLAKLGDNQEIWVVDPKVRSQDGALLKAVDENAAKNIKIAINGMSDKSFAPVSKFAEKKAGFSGVCVYGVDSNGIKEVWVNATLKD